LPEEEGEISIMMEKPEKTALFLAKKPKNEQNILSKRKNEGFIA